MPPGCTRSAEPRRAIDVVAPTGVARVPRAVYQPGIGAVDGYQAVRSRLDQVCATRCDRRIRLHKPRSRRWICCGGMSPLRRGRHQPAAERRETAWRTHRATRRCRPGCRHGRRASSSPAPPRLDDPAARRQCCFEPHPDLLPCDRHIDVHRVPQRLGLVELLHPDRRSVSERIDGVVVGHGLVAERGAPEADVDRGGLGGDRKLDLLYGGAVGDRSCATREPDTARARSTCRVSSCHMSRLSRTVRRSCETVRSTPDPAKSEMFARASISRAASRIDGTRNTAVAPPWSTTQSSRPFASRNSCQPSSLISVAP